MDPSNHKSPTTGSSKGSPDDLGMNYSEKIPPYYKCFGVHPSISMQDLSRRYKKLSLELHPDRATYRANPLSKEDIERFQLITEAYKVLSDPQTRTAYDTRHGVNFHARLSALQETIASHNSEAIQPQTERGGRRRGRSPESLSGNPDTGIRLKSESERSDDADDSEEEYCPAESAESHGLPDAGPTPVLSSQLSWALGPGKTATETFRLYPADLPHPEAPKALSPGGIGSLAATFPNDANALPHEGDHYQTITIHRPAGAQSWGLRIRGDVLVGCPSHPGVPFPARIVQVNGRVLPSHAIWDVLRGRIADETGLLVRDRTSPSPGPSTLLSQEGPSSAADGGGAAVTTPGKDREELQLTLLYGVRGWRLVGDWAELRDPAAMAALVPPGQVVAALPSLGMDAAVLAVNGTPVRDADGMRRLLTRLAVKDASNELSKASSLGPSTVILECATLNEPMQG
ncbi:unnamed protein product [Phytomonas sp. EM1]|nr:unnamed protein product [Phytomonas sp. EM1]|eukprot:CCW62353.1 unnamed protein product [Phytomonas sp. isolate EM1]